MSDSSLRDVFGTYLMENGNKFKDIVVLDADLSSSTRTYKFAKAFPKRFFNMGIAEQNMLGTAIGFAISGKTPVVSGFSMFTTGRAWEFIRLACHDNLNIKIITTHAGIVGEDGSTHNALEDISLMAVLPNLAVLVPSDKIELIEILEYVFNNPGPFYVRLPRGSFSDIHTQNYNFSLGEPDVIKEGDDICLIGTGFGSILGLKAAPLLEKQLNISIKVINLSTIKPINNKLITNEVENMKGIVVIEEHNIYCGFGSILARIFSNIMPIPMKFIGINNSFGQSGTRDSLLNYYGLNIENLKQQIKILLNQI